jgi:hypothetical protein
MRGSSNDGGLCAADCGGQAALLTFHAWRHARTSDPLLTFVALT